MQELDARLDNLKAGLKQPEWVDVSPTIAARWGGQSPEPDELMASKEDEERWMDLSQKVLNDCGGAVKVFAGTKEGGSDELGWERGRGAVGERFDCKR